MGVILDRKAQFDAMSPQASPYRYLTQKIKGNYVIAKPDAFLEGKKIRIVSVDDPSTKQIVTIVALMRRTTRSIILKCEDPKTHQILVLKTPQGDRTRIEEILHEANVYHQARSAPYIYHPQGLYTDKKKHLYILGELMEGNLERLTLTPMTQECKDAIAMQLIWGTLGLEALDIYTQDLRPGNVLYSQLQAEDNGTITSMKVHLHDFDLCYIMEDVAQEADVSKKIGVLKQFLGEYYDAEEDRYLVLTKPSFCGDAERTKKIEQQMDLVVYKEDWEHYQKMRHVLGKEVFGQLGKTLYCLYTHSFDETIPHPEEAKYVLRKVLPKETHQVLYKVVLELMFIK